jgi:elongation factor Ts
MASVTVQDINKLRKLTGVGMMDCKKALVESDGDFDKAIDYLREKGKKLAAKRADRAANEGCVLAQTSADKTFAAVIMINCETDFVAQNEGFVSFTKSVLDAAVNAKAKTIEEVNALSVNGTKVETLLVDQVAKIGEKITLSQYKAIEAEVTYAYTHPGNRMASVVGLNKKDFDKVGKEMAMQVVSMRPISVDKNSVPQDVIEKEMEVYRVQIREEGKPENMVEKIAEGKLNKFFKESTLMPQEFILESKMSVEEYLKKQDKDLTVVSFARSELGA